ncbi:MAG: phosphate ABC transporter substrate-binding protein PstS family protein [Dehalococcoidia bacterium]|nr:phosphate ABC transporter substrate-binding protein PstS family protein [Dehalococcoidia bacterium]
MLRVPRGTRPSSALRRPRTNSPQGGLSTVVRNPTKHRLPLLFMLMVSAVALFAVGCDDDDGGNGSGNGGTTSTPAGSDSTSMPAGSDSTSTPMAGGEIDYGSLSGSVRVDGSSTVFPISEAVAEEFSLVSDVRANVAFSGTGGGFEKFCRGEIEISDASRPIQDDEVAACAANGIEDIVEIQVAIDALTVMVNPGNDFAECLTIDEVNNIFRGDGATNWSQVRDGFPDQPISWYYPGTDSGTFDYFVEAAIEGVDEEATHRGDGTSSEDDNILLQGIANDPNAIGYFGFAYFLAAGDELKAVAVDGGDGCVEPSFDAALDGSYQPLARPIFIYTTETLLAERPEVLGFINFYLENLGELVPEVGYVTMPEDLHQEQVAKIEPFLQ